MCRENPFGADLKERLASGVKSNNTATHPRRVCHFLPVGEEGKKDRTSPLRQLGYRPSQETKPHNLASHFLA